MLERADRVDGNALDMTVGAWLFQRARKHREGEWEFALDGKVVRGAWPDENGQVTLFSAMIHREAITIAEVSALCGTNDIAPAGEIPARWRSGRRTCARHRRCRPRAA
jgi:hypothetical protein